MPGVPAKVQVPVEGNPFKTTPPVAIKQVGWVKVSTTGAVGVNGWALIITVPDSTEMHEDRPSVTV